MHVRQPFLGLLLLALAVAGGMTACSSDSEPKLSPDDAISQLMGQGYTQQSAQCLIDGTQQQNIDIYSFLARSRFTQHEIDVVNSVGAYCLEHYGYTGTTLAP